jgi:uncharacterized membrane protein YidH (DUF202 family)
VAAEGDRRDELVDRAYQVGDTALAAAPEPAGDPRAAILALAVVQIVLGGLFALLALVMTADTENRDYSAAIGFSVPAINLLATGIGGTVRARWARRATVISAIVWLALLALFGLAVLVAGASPPDDTSWEEGKAFAIPVLVGWAVLPIVLIVFFTRPRVRAAFQRPAA